MLELSINYVRFANSYVGLTNSYIWLINSYLQKLSISYVGLIDVLTPT